MDNICCNNRNPIISLSRICGMLLIVLCHVVVYYCAPIGSALSGFLNCGVELFLLISGYLFGQRIIDNWTVFYSKRFRTVTVPAIIASALVIAALLIARQPLEWQSIVAYLLDAEGLLFLNWDFVTSNLFNEILSLGPLWFTTIIMLCYLLIPLLQRVAHLNSIRYILFIIIGLIIVIICPFIHLEYFFVFSIGYFAGKIDVLDKIGSREFIFFTGLFILSLLLRIGVHHYFGSSPLYARLTVIPSTISGAWFIALFAYINGASPEKTKLFTSSRAIQLCDKYSYYVFLSHGVFCMGTFNLYSRFSLPVASLLFLVFTVVGAVCIRYISGHISTLVSSICYCIKDKRPE